MRPQRLPTVRAALVVVAGALALLAPAPAAATTALPCITAAGHTIICI